MVVGVMLLIVGLIVMAYSMAIKRNGKRSVMGQPIKDQEEYMMLLRSGLNILMVAGLFLVIVGGLLIL